MMHVTPKPDDTIAWLTIRLRAHGALSIEGHLGDKRLALQLLEHARDAINAQVTDSPIVIPNRDVDVRPLIPLREVGSMPLDQRGDD